MSVTQTPNGYSLNDSGRRVVVDPVTRIEGHMRCEVEDALGIQIPKNAHLIREMMAKTLQVHDHVVHFYHLHALDWVNPVNALKADPKETSKIQHLVSAHHPKSSPGYFRDIQTRIRKFIESGQLGPFKNGYWDNPAYRLPPEVDLMAVAHYLEALDIQKEFVKVHTVFGGKNPHPNYLVGGVPCAINMDGNLSAGAPLNMERLNFVKARIDEMKTFCDNVYIPDVIAIASFYKGWLHGGGHGARNVMDYGAYPKVNYDKSTDRLPGGVILNDNWNEVFPVDPRDPEQVQEFVAHSWYSYPDESKGLHPGRERQVFLDQGAALAWSRGGGGPAVTLHARLCTERRVREGAGAAERRHIQPAGGHGSRCEDGTAVDHRPHPGTRTGGPVLRRHDGR